MGINAYREKVEFGAAVCTAAALLAINAPKIREVIVPADIEDVAGVYCSDRPVYLDSGNPDHEKAISVLNGIRDDFNRKANSIGAPSTDFEFTENLVFCKPNVKFPAFHFPYGGDSYIVYNPLCLGSGCWYQGKKVDPIKEVEEIGAYGNSTFKHELFHTVQNHSGSHAWLDEAAAAYFENENVRDEMSRSFDADIYDPAKIWLEYLMEQAEKKGVDPNELILRTTKNGGEFNESFVSNLVEFDSNLNPVVIDMLLNSEADQLAKKTVELLKGHDEIGDALQVDQKVLDRWDRMVNSGNFESFSEIQGRMRLKRKLKRIANGILLAIGAAISALMIRRKRNS